MSEQENGLMYSDVAIKEETKYVVDTTLSDTTNTDEDKSASNKDTDWKKRYDDLRRHQNQKQQEFREKEKELKSQLNQARPHYEPPKNSEELKAFKEENPDVYGVAESLAHLRVNQELEEVKNEIEELKEVKKNATRTAALAELKQFHPDFEEIKTDAVFKEWSRKQPREIQKWLFSGQDAKLAARAIDLFKAEHQKVADTQGKLTQQEEIADAVSTKSAVVTTTPGEKVWTQAEIARMSVAQYEKHREEIDTAFVEGRVK